MFYSETLLSKTGPLARVWLSANLERKLSKTHILQSNIETSVNAIVDQGQAPMALRLSGQLLLGVVRIYSRKARYLMDDCNEALLKIKMAFRPGNLDMTLVNSEIPNPGLTMPDAIAEPEVLPMLDEALLNSRPMDIDFGSKENDPLNWSSLVFSDPLSTEQCTNAQEQPFLYEDDLGLDLDIGDGPSIEMGRDAPAARSIGEDLMSDDGKLHDDDMGFNYTEDEPFETRLSVGEPMNPLIEEGLMDVENPDHFAFDLDDTVVPATTLAEARLQRDSQSPLSSLRSSVVREFDDTTMSELPHQARQPVSKKRKLLPLDTETTIHSSQIKQQQVDRSAILRPASFLPKDPVLLALMKMQQSGAFVSNIMGDGRNKGWAPELRGILSIELIKESGALKRKRDSGVADVDQEEAQANINDLPQLEIPEDEDIVVADEGIAIDDENVHKEMSTMIDLSADGGFVVDGRPIPAGSDGDVMSPMKDNFDETTAPLVHPADQGPVSLGTQHAVHLLRGRFGGTEGTASQQSRANVLFQDLLPEASTSKGNATKMFFEVLVLATKDAVKVDQAEGELGGPIRIRGKRGLWGAWAEREAGGEIAQQDEQPSTAIAVS